MTPAASSPGRQQDEQGNERTREVWEAQRAALAEAFPTWKIVCVSPMSVPLWFALYRHPLTPQQEQAGFRPTILRGSAEALQAELALRCQPTRLPLPLSAPLRAGAAGRGETSRPRPAAPPRPPAKWSFLFPKGPPPEPRGDRTPPRGPQVR